MTFKQSIQTFMRSVLKPKTIAIILAVLSVALAASSIYLYSNLAQTRQRLGQAEESLTFILGYSKEKDAQLNQANEDLARSGEENRGLNDQITQLDAEKGEVEARAALYRAQKYYFLDAMDYIGRLYGYRDVEQAVRAFSVFSGQSLPESCEVQTAERYLHWTSTTSTIFVASPVKLGLSNYVGWSLRENVVFGPDHVNQPGITISKAGYLGSRGYELRYPLIPGTWPLQEIHTTINVYEDVVDGNYWNLDNFDRMVDLDCGIKGTIRISDDKDETKTIYFVLGNFAANVKIKYYYDDLNGAINYLTLAANTVIADLTAGW